MKIIKKKKREQVISLRVLASRHALLSTHAHTHRHTKCVSPLLLHTRRRELQSQQKAYKNVIILYYRYSSSTPHC